MGGAVAGIVREVWQGEVGRSRVVERYIGEGDRGVGKGQVKFGDLIERY